MQYLSLTQKGLKTVFDEAVIAILLPRNTKGKKIRMGARWINCCLITRETPSVAKEMVCFFSESIQNAAAIPRLLINKQIKNLKKENENSVLCTL